MEEHKDGRSYNGDFVDGSGDVLAMLFLINHSLLVVLNLTACVFPLRLGFAYLWVMDLPFVGLSS